MRCRRQHWSHQRWSVWQHHAVARGRDQINGGGTGLHAAWEADLAERQQIDA